MFKNATIFGINPKFKADTAEIDLEQFSPVGEAEFESSGWGEAYSGFLSYHLGKQVMMSFVQEKKHIPSSAVDSIMEERCRGMEAVQGFAPGKKAKKELKERVIDDLLPRALATRRKTAVWLDLEKHRLVIDSTSQPVIDEIQKALNKAFDDIGIQDVSWPGAKVVTEWLVEEPSNFTTDDEVTLQYPGEHGKSVKFKASDLAGADVQEHVQKGGASVESIAMTYDSRLSFMMTSNCQVRRIKALDIITTATAPADVDKFDAELTLMTLELGNLIDVLIAEA